MVSPDSDNDVGQTDETAPPKRPPRRLWIVAAVGVVFVLVMAPVAFTMVPAGCSACHEMRPYYDSWQASSHRGAVTTCVPCHVKPGVGNTIGFGFSLYGMVLAHVAGAQVKSTNANAPSVDSCLRQGCHSLNREVSNSGDLKIDHRLHVARENIACPTCHPGAVHAGVGGRLKLPPMKLCTKCHADKMNDCNYCHTQQHLQAQPGTHELTPTAQ